MKIITNTISYLFFAAVMIIFTACDQSATSVLKKDPLFGQNLQYTKIGKIVIDNEVQALVNVTYLNSVKSKIWDNGKQNFLVGTYIVEDSNRTYTLTLNENLEAVSSSVPKDDLLFENIALKNNWATYEILSFETPTSDLLNVVFQDDLNRSSVISFTKE